MIVGWGAAAFGAEWVLRERLVTEVRPPIALAPWVRAEARSTWFVRWEGDQLSVTLCALEQDPVMGATISFPPTLRPTYVRTARFDGAAFGMGPVVETIGGADDDGDGHPGVSMTVHHPRVGQGQVYVEQRATLAWTGRLGDDGAITGALEYLPEQEVLGASRWWLGLPLAQRAVPGSTFALAPLPAGTVGCAGVRP